MQGLSSQDPADMRPPGTVLGTVRITLVIRMLVMNAMCGYPENRAALQSERAARRNEVFQPLRRHVAAMCKQAVISHTDAHIDCQKIQGNSDDKIGPAKEEESCNRASMEESHKENRDPVDLALFV